MANPFLTISGRGPWMKLHLHSVAHYLHPVNIRLYDCITKILAKTLYIKCIIIETQSPALLKIPEWSGAYMPCTQSGNWLQWQMSKEKNSPMEIFKKHLAVQTLLIHSTHLMFKGVIENNNFILLPACCCERRGPKATCLILHGTWS